MGQAGVAGDLGVQALRVPRRAQDVLPLEQGAELRARQVPALAGGAVDHDLQQGPQRRHGPLDGAVSPVVLGHHLVGGDDDVHRVGEDRLILQLGTQHLLGEDDVGVQEDPAEEGRGEGLVHAVAQARGLDGATLVLEVLDALEVAALDEAVGVALLSAHAREDLRDEQRDVVGHLHLRADVAGRGQPAVVATEGVGQQGRVEVVDGRQGVERGLGEGSLAAGARRRGGLAGHGGDELHEQLGQLHVVQRVVGAQRRNPVLGRVVAAPGGDDVDAVAQCLVQGHVPEEVVGQVRQRHVLRVGDVGTHLEVAGVLGGGAVDQARVGRGDPVGLLSGVLGLGQGGGAGHQVLHGLGEAGQTGGVGGHRPGVGGRQRLEVGDEQVRLRIGHVRLGLLVVAAHDRVVGPLEEQGLAVGDELAGQLRVRGGDQAAGGHDRCGDVVLGLDLGRRREVGAQGQQAPGAVVLEAHAQHVDLDDLTVQAQGVALAAVDDAHGEVAAPVLAPAGLVEALDGEDELLDVGRDRLQEGVVLLGVHRRRRQQLDDASQRAALGEDRAVVVALVGRVDEAVGVVAVEDRLDGVEVLVDVADVGLTEDEGVQEGLGDLRLAAAGDGGRLVGLRGPGGGAHQVPLGGVALAVLGVDPVAVGGHVGVAHEQRD